MITFVGTQANFIDAVNDLLEMEFEALEIYEAAIHRLDSENYRAQLQEFKKDHEKHVFAIKKYIKSCGETPAMKPSGKQILVISRISLSAIIGDMAILKSLLAAEEDTNLAYERINNHAEKPSSMADKLKAFYKDEKKHKAWLKKITANS